MEKILCFIFMQLEITMHENRLLVFVCMLSAKLYYFISPGTNSLHKILRCSWTYMTLVVRALIFLERLQYILANCEYIAFHIFLNWANKTGRAIRYWRFSGAFEVDISNKSYNRYIFLFNPGPYGSGTLALSER